MAVLELPNAVGMPFRSKPSPYHPYLQLLVIGSWGEARECFFFCDSPKKNGGVNMALRYICGNESQVVGEVGKM